MKASRYHKVLVLCLTLFLFQVTPAWRARAALSLREAYADMHIPTADPVKKIPRSAKRVKSYREYDEDSEDFEVTLVEKRPPEKMKDTDKEKDKERERDRERERDQERERDRERAQTLKTGWDERDKLVEDRLNKAMAELEERSRSRLQAQLHLQEKEVQDRDRLLAQQAKQLADMQSELALLKQAERPRQEQPERPRQEKPERPRQDKPEKTPRRWEFEESPLKKTKSASASAESPTATPPYHRRRDGLVSPQTVANLIAQAEQKAARKANLKLHDIRKAVERQTLMELLYEK